MKMNPLLTLATVAVGTTALTVAMFWSNPLDAGTEAEALPAKVQKPRFITHGIEFTLATAQGRVFEAGDRPMFELTAQNTTEAPAEATICATMTATSPANALSRMVMLPLPLWEQQQSIVLKAKETKVLTLTANTNLPPKNLVTVFLREVLPITAPAPLQGRGPSVVVLSFSTGTPAVPAALMTSK